MGTWSFSRWIFRRNNIGTLAANKSSWESLMWSSYDAFMGFVPGSIGETSVVAVLLGAAFLMLTGIGSWRIILSTFIGGYLTALYLIILV